MKIILMFLLGVVLTQTNVSTKHIPIDINQNTSQIDFSDYVSFEDNGHYYVTLIFYENFISDCELGSDENNGVSWELNFYTDLFPETIYQHLELDYDWNEGSHQYYIEDANLILNQNNKILTSDYTEFFDLGCSQFSGTFYFQITGLFEDEGVGLQGDMNDDEVINVTDIIALVNIIIGD